MQWTREESLSTVAIAEFVELPERKAVQSSAAESENFVSRVLRHISDAQASSLLPGSLRLADLHATSLELPSIPRGIRQAIRHRIICLCLRRDFA